MPTLAEQESRIVRFGPGQLTNTPARKIDFNYRVEEKYFSDCSVLTTTVSPLTVFVVTGTVEVKLVGMGQVITSTATTGTLAVGMTGLTTLLLGTTTANGTNFPTAVDAVWIDTSSTVAAEAIVASNLVGVLTTANIIMTIATNSMTGGALRLMCAWRPWSSDGSVVAA